MIRKDIHFSGNVQGVGFRYRTAELAKQFTVYGTVQNLNDGRVKLVIEGSLHEVQGFLFELRQRLIDHIDHDKCEDKKYSGDFSDFQIIR